MRYPAAFASVRSKMGRFAFQARGRHSAHAGPRGFRAIPVGTHHNPSPIRIDKERHA